MPEVRDLNIPKPDEAPCCLLMKREQILDEPQFLLVHAGEYSRRAWTMWAGSNLGNRLNLKVYEPGIREPVKRTMDAIKAFRRSGGEIIRGSIGETTPKGTMCLQQEPVFVWFQMTSASVDHLKVLKALGNEGEALIFRTLRNHGWLAGVSPFKPAYPGPSIVERRWEMVFPELMAWASQEGTSSSYLRLGSWGVRKSGAGRRGGGCPRGWFDS